MRLSTTNRWPFVFFLGALPWIACANLGFGDEPKFRFVDNFDAEHTLDWEPVRHDPDLVSLTKNPGKLTITTQRGTLGFDETRAGVVPARNLYLTPNPVDKGGDFVLTTCIESFRPTLKYQQAGLLIYDDDDNYLKFDMEWGGDDVRFKHMRETNQVRLLDTDIAVPDSKRVWMRITKRGNVYERSFSTDGKEFVSIGEKSWGTGDPEWVGLIAVNGGVTEEGIDAAFDFVEIRALNNAEKNDPRELARQEFAGSWKVVTCDFSGKPLEHSPLSAFVFDGGQVTFTEQAREVTVDYVLNPNDDPKGFVMSAISRGTQQPANGIYSLDSDTLVICLALKPGAPAPTELKTNENDSQLLLKLQRVKPDKEAEKSE